MCVICVNTVINMHYKIRSIFIFLNNLFRKSSIFSINKSFSYGENLVNRFVVIQSI